MRDIKFRAWHKLAHKIIDIDMLDFALDAYRGHAGRWSGSGHLADIELMQSTGLVYNNDRDIYEGDILGKPGEPRTFFQIVWDGSALAWAGQSPWAGRWLLAENRPDSSDIVLGNIYENPELLPKSKE